MDAYDTEIVTCEILDKLFYLICNLDACCFTILHVWITQNRSKIPRHSYRKQKFSVWFLLFLEQLMSFFSLTFILKLNHNRQVSFFFWHIVAVAAVCQSNGIYLLSSISCHIRFINPNNNNVMWPRVYVVHVNIHSQTKEKTKQFTSSDESLSISIVH